MGVTTYLNFFRSNILSSFKNKLNIKSTIRHCSVENIYRYKITDVKCQSIFARGDFVTSRGRFPRKPGYEQPWAVMFDHLRI